MVKARKRPADPAPPRPGPRGAVAHSARAPPTRSTPKPAERPLPCDQDSEGDRPGRQAAGPSRSRDGGAQAGRACPRSQPWDVCPVDTEDKTCTRQARRSSEVAGDTTPETREALTPWGVGTGDGAATRLPALRQGQPGAGIPGSEGEGGTGLGESQLLPGSETARAGLACPPAREQKLLAVCGSAGNTRPRASPSGHVGDTRSRPHSPDSPASGELGGRTGNPPLSPAGWLGASASQEVPAMLTKAPDSRRHR